MGGFGSTHANTFHTRVLSILLAAPTRFGCFSIQPIGVLTAFGLIATVWYNP